MGRGLVKRRGQVLMLVTPVLAVFTLLLALALSYAILTLRSMRVTAIADAAAHAGAMEIHVLPNGQVATAARAQRVAATFFANQAPSYAKLQWVKCGLAKEGPYCDVAAEVRVDFLVSTSAHVQVRSVLAYGATRGGQ